MRRATPTAYFVRASVFPYVGQGDLLDTRFPIKDARLLKYEKSIYSIILPSFSSLSRSGIFFSFEKRASFLENHVFLYIYRVSQKRRTFLKTEKNIPDLLSDKKEGKIKE